MTIIIIIVTITIAITAVIIIIATIAITATIITAVCVEVETVIEIVHCCYYYLLNSIINVMTFILMINWKHNMAITSIIGFYLHSILLKYLWEIILEVTVRATVTAIIFIEIVENKKFMN